MRSETSVVATQYRLQEWAAQIKDCQNRPEGMKVFNPSFDVTPHQNITAIITERGIAYPPFDKAIGKLLNGGML